MMPGPIQGAMNAFIFFGVPLIRVIGGHSSTDRFTIRAPLAEAWQARNRFQDFTKVLYVRIDSTDGVFRAHPILGETESMTTLTTASGYVVIPEGKTKIGEGQKVEVEVLPGFSYLGRIVYCPPARVDHEKQGTRDQILSQR